MQIEKLIISIQKRPGMFVREDWLINLPLYAVENIVRDQVQNQLRLIDIEMHKIQKNL